MEYKNCVYVASDDSFKVLTKEEVFQSDFGQMKAIASIDSKRQKDLMYVQFVLCHEGPNLNNYYFLRDELENSYQSVVYKLYNWEHDEKEIIGTITDSVLIKPPVGSVDPRWRIECGAVVWKWVVPEYAKKIAEKATTGELRNSMECYFDDYYYVLGDEDIVYPRELRPDLEGHFGRLFNGRKVYRGFKNMFFGGVGVVAKPADLDAVFKSVAKRDVVGLDGDSLLEFIANDIGGEVFKVIVNDQDLAVQEANLDEQKIVDVESAKDKDIDDKKEEVINEVTEEAVVDECLEDCEEITEEDTSVSNDLEDVNKDAGVEEVADEPKEISGKEKAEQYREASSLLTEYLGRMEIIDKYNNLYHALDYAIHAVIYNDEILDKKSVVMDEVVVFVSQLLSILPQYDSVFANSNDEESVSEESGDVVEVEEDIKEENVDSEIEDIKQANEDLKKQLSELQKQFDEYRNAIEEEKKRIKMQEIAEQRVLDLESLGCSFSKEKRLEIKEKILAKSEEEYSEFKAILLDVASSINKEVANINPNSDVNLSALNIESSKPPSIIEGMESLAKAVFSKK